MEDLGDRLPEMYAAYFELRRRGATLADVAIALDLSDDSLDAFIDLAHRKLRNATSQWRDGDGPGRIQPWESEDPDKLGR